MCPAPKSDPTDLIHDMSTWYLSFFSSFIPSPELPRWSVDRLTLTKSFLTFSPLTRIWVLGKHKRLWNLIHDACSTSMQCPACTGRWTWLLKSTMPCKKCAAAQPAECCISSSYDNAIDIQNVFLCFYDTMQVCILTLLELIQHSCTSYHCCRISLVVACVNRERPPSGGWRGLSCGNNILMRIHLFLLSATVWINFYFCAFKQFHQQPYSYHNHKHLHHHNHDTQHEQLCRTRPASCFFT